jgi:YNFM family putative membrane transporter
MFLSGLSVFAQLYLFQPMLPLMCKEFQITPSQSSWAVSATTIGMAIGLFIFSFKADALPRKQLMGTAMLVSPILTLLSAFCTQYPLLIAINVIKGGVLAGVSAVALAYLAEELVPSVLGLAISLYLSGNVMGGMSGRIAATLMSGYIGWRWAVVVIGVVSLLLGILFVYRLPASNHFTPRPVPVRDKWGQLGTILKDSFTNRVFIAAAILVGTFVSVYNYLGFRLEEPPFSLPHYVVAGIFVMYTVGVAGTMCAGKWSDKRPPASLIHYFLIAIVAGLALLLLHNLWLLVLGLGLVTFGFFGAHTLASRMVSNRAGSGKSAATSIYWLFYYLGSTSLGSGTGVLLARGGWGWFIGSLMILMTAGGLLLLGLRTKK